MICPQCQSDNPASAAFCDECGARLETACPNCGQAINQPSAPISIPSALAPAPDTYVPKHLAEKILATRHTLEGERKQVTVLFADIRDSTRLIEGLHPEDA